MKMQLLKNKKTIMLSEKQRLLLAWLFRHAARYLTAYSTWQMLFNQRESEAPDECIAIYDELTLKEKIDVELIFARFISIRDLDKHRGKKFSDWIHYLSYQEV